MMIVLDRFGRADLSSVASWRTIAVLAEHGHEQRGLGTRFASIQLPWATCNPIIMNIVVDLACIAPRPMNQMGLGEPLSLARRRRIRRTSCTRVEAMSDQRLRVAGSKLTRALASRFGAARS